MRVRNPVSQRYWVSLVVITVNRTVLDPHGDRAALYQLSLNGLGTFEKCQQGLPTWFSDNIDTKSLVASGNKAAFGTSEGDIFVSDDAGQTWKQLGNGLPPIQCLDLV